MELLCKITFNFTFRAFGFGSLPFRGGNFHFGNRAYNCNYLVLGFLVIIFWIRSGKNPFPPLLPFNSSICVPNMKTQLYFCFQIIDNTNDVKLIHLNLLSYTVFSIYNFFFTIYHETMHSYCWLFSKKVSGG